MPIETSGTTLSAILWDMDGTLVDTEPVWVQCERELMADFDYAWNEADAAFCIGGPMEKVEQYMYEKSGRRENPSWFGERLVEMMLERLTSDVIVKPGVRSMIDESSRAGVKQALVSASRRAIVDAVVRGIGISFDFVVSASEVARSKPHPEGYLTSAARLGIPIHECVVFEDSPVGILAGVESGTLTLGLSEVEIEHQNFRRIGTLLDFSYEDLTLVHRDWVIDREGAGTPR